jgi:FMN phosphatase YigB (HAD superfamily)
MVTSNALRDTRLLLVDMDNTLCNTYLALSKVQWEAVAQAFEARGKLEYAMALRRNLGRKGFAATLKQLKMSPAERQFAIKVYDRVDIRRLQLYPDAPALLKLDLPKVLVSRGERKLQLRKIRHLGIGGRFDRIVIVPTFEEKGAAFKRLLALYKLKPSQALVIGDRPEDEITDARRLRIPTCLVRRPEGNAGSCNATMTVRSLRSVAKRLQ